MFSRHSEERIAICHTCITFRPVYIGDVFGGEELPPKTIRFVRENEFGGSDVSDFELEFRFDDALFDWIAV